MTMKQAMPVPLPGRFKRNRPFLPSVTKWKTSNRRRGILLRTDLMACQAKQARAMLEQDTTSKSRQILMALAAKLQEKEAAMEQIRLEHDATLAYIARQLAFLQANMLKEQQKLEAVITEKSRAMEALALENERLRKHNKKLVSKHLTNSSQDTTASSQESSPKSSFSSKSSSDLRLPPAPPPVMPTTSPSKVGDVKPPTGPKPPVPSRAGINKLLLQSTNLVVSPPPPPPVRSTSLAISHLERKDSGRESDLPSDVEPNKRHTSSTDEGFCSSHEDSSGSGGRCSRTSSINHRAVQKPSDIKLRSKAKAAAAASATSTTSPPLSTLREVDGHPPASSSGVTTVTYWTGSFL